MTGPPVAHDGVAPPWAIHLPADVDPAGLELGGRGLTGYWAQRWSSDPDRVLLCGIDGARLRAGELERATARVAGRLAGAGLTAGDRILVSAATSLDLVVAYVGALRLGLVVVPFNPAYRETEIAHIVRDAEPLAAIVDDDQRAAWVRAAAPDPILIVGTDVALPDAAPGPLDTASGDDLALIGYTSGTTGASKGAGLTNTNLLAGAQAVQLAWRWTAEDRLILALPLFHMHGLGVGLHGTLTSGASAVLLPSFEVTAVLDAADHHDASLFFGVPTMYARLAQSSRVSELSRFRLCASGSAALPSVLFESIRDQSGQRVIERYGLTETVMNVSNPYDGERRPGTVGFPLPGVDIRLDEELGEIEVRGPNVFPGYWRSHAATTAAFTSDGWFRTGDLGRRDDDGYLHIAGRLKELIITGGLNVHPREVEDVLLAHPGVAEVAVVGQPSDEWGELVTAFVVPTGSSLDLAELSRFARERLAAFKCPRRVELVDALPRNALGKVLKHELKSA
jgi:malonyl-CoA/methylmalonyl-CoA synthetase